LALLTMVQDDFWSFKVKISVTESFSFFKLWRFRLKQ
jgi:hypothetical protein